MPWTIPKAAHSAWTLTLLFLLFGWAWGRELPDRVAWVTELSGPAGSNLVAAGADRVFLLAGGELVCLNAADGTRIWSALSPGGYSYDPVRLEVHGKLVLCHPDSYRSMAAYRVENGVIAWTAPPAQSSCRVGDRVWLGQSERLVALNATTGQEEVSLPGGATVLMAQGTRVWFQTRDAVGVLDSATAKVVHQEPLRGRHLVAPGLLGTERELVGLTPDFKPAWRRARSQDDELHAAGRILVLVGSGRSLGLEVSSGRPLWSFNTPRRPYDLHLLGDGLAVLRGGWGADLIRLSDGRRLLRAHEVSSAAVGGNSTAVAAGDAVVELNVSGRRTFKAPGLISPCYELVEVPGCRVGDRLVVVSGGTLVALGAGPGRLVRLGTPTVSVSAQDPQLPPTLGLTVSGAFLRGASVEVTDLLSGQVVKRQQLDLRSGYAHQSKGVRLRVPGPGRYRVTARGAGQQASTEVEVSDLGILAKTTPTRIWVMVQDVLKSQPAAGVAVSVPGAGQGLTGPDGTVDFPLTPAQGLRDLKVEARRGRLALSLHLNTSVPATRHKIFLETDRPLYRPGHRVFFRGVVTSLEEGDQHLTGGLPVQVRILDSSDNKLLETTVTTDELGCFHGDMRLGDEPPLGRYRVLAEAALARGSLPFEVQEYRKPPFEVLVRPREPLTVAGQPLDFEVSAAYFFGGPVAEADVRWELYYETLYLYNDEEPGETPYRSYRSFQTQGTGKMGADGKLKVRVDSARVSDDRRYHLAVRVLGPEGREVEGGASALVSPAAFGVFLRPASWVVTRGEPLPVRVRTVDLLGRPHAARVSLQVRQGRETVQRLQVDTDASGNGKTAVRSSRSGYLDLEAEVRDGGGRRASARSWVWVTGADADWDYPDLRVIPQKITARPGERIRCLIMASKPGTVWFTVEGGSVYDSRVIRMTARTAVVDLTVKREYAPLVYLKASMPRAGGVSSDSVALKVPSEEHRLQVEVTPDRGGDFRPGATARLSVTTRAQGQPVPAELSLAVVDEALLAMRPDFTPNIYDFFHASRELAVESFHRIPQRSWVAGFQTVDAPVPVRENFQDTAYWRADVRTDAQGQASVEVPMPDNLTRWRAMARGVALPASAGQGTASLLTRLPLMVQALAPRFLVAGDRSDVLAQVLNRSETAQTVDVSLAATGARLLEPGRGNLSVERDASARMVTRVEAEPVGEAVLEATVRGAGEADAERIRLPVLPFASHRDRFDGGLLESGRSFDFELPAEALNPRLTVRVSGSPVAAIEGVLGYLAHYPYGCAEQTMSSFLPTVAASEACGRLGLPAPVERAELEKMVSAGLQTLYGYQHSDGGWGWWESDPTHPYMTGYVLFGLSRAAQAGWPVSETSLQQGRAAARSLLEHTPGTAERAYLAWSLTVAGEPPVEALQQLAARPQELDTYSRALVAWSLRRAGKVEVAAPLLAHLRSSVKEDGNQACWDASALYAYGWTDDDVEATCAVLQALLEENPADPLIPRGVAWVLGQRRGDQWKSTRDSAMAVLLLTDFAVKRGLKDSRSTLSLSLDGRALPPVEPASKETLAEVPVDRPGRHTLSLEPAAGSPIAAVHLEYWMPAVAGAILPEERGLKLDRVIRRVGQRSPLFSAVRPQELVEVELTITAPREMQYVILEDYRPAGTAAVEQEQADYRVSRREDRDEKTVFFFTTLPEGVTRIVYRQRAETPGVYQALPARAWLMYRPEVGGSSSSQRVEIAR
ncbi:MAG: MG2 domain-containing protein [Candidatus Eremiobacterota bacterium]